MTFENIPPLKALRYFEVAARHGSFTRAAAELNVTQGAISQQVRNLEDHLGGTLFIRGATSISLTEMGHDYFESIGPAFQKIDAATLRARHAHSTDPGEEICLSASPAFMNIWLVQRLSRFHDEVRGVRLSLNASRHYVDFEKENVDIAIRHGDGQWPGLHSELLIRDRIIAVCSPGLVGRHKPTAELSEIARFPLIEDKFHRYWSRYAVLKKVDLDLSGARRFDDSGVIVEAAINGQGIAMARASLAKTALRDGRLIKLFDADFPGNIGYHIIFPANRRLHKGLERLRRWLRREARATAHAD